MILRSLSLAVKSTSDICVEHHQEIPHTSILRDGISATKNRSLKRSINTRDCGRTLQVPYGNFSRVLCVANAVSIERGVGDHSAPIDVYFLLSYIKWLNSINNHISFRETYAYTALQG
jgi:hypothetical protein